jgi:DNA-binding NarL/FixJ family response regulator
MENKIKIAIADDHKIFRHGVMSSLQSFSDLEFILEAEDGQQLIEKIETAEVLPDVILMDLRMPNTDGIEATKHISKKFPNIYILALTMFEDEKFVLHLMENGANGYLLKNTDPAEIRRAILDVQTKGYYLNNFVNRVLLKRNKTKVKSAPVVNHEISMNDRETEVVKLMCMEYTAAEIAKSMDISPRTVEAIKDRLMERFGVKNTAGLIFYVVKNNLVS